MFGNWLKSLFSGDAGGQADDSYDARFMRHREAVEKRREDDRRATEMQITDLETHRDLNISDARMLMTNNPAIAASKIRVALAIDETIGTIEDEQHRTTRSDTATIQKILAITTGAAKQIETRQKLLQIASAAGEPELPAESQPQKKMGKNRLNGDSDYPLPEPSTNGKAHGGR